MKKKILLAIGVGALVFLGSAVGGYIAHDREVDASRNSSGTMSLPNTFVAGTTISSSSVNANFSDIGSELTNSLERNGKGGMLAALRGVDGTVAAPAFSYTSETGSGYFRNGAGDVRMSILGALVGQWTANGLRVANGAVATPGLSFTNDTGSGFYRIGSNDIGFAINGTKVQEITSSATTLAMGGTKLAVDGTTVTNEAGIWVGSNATTPSTTNFSFLAAPTETVINATTGNVVDFRINNSQIARVSGSGVTIGSSGTAISASFEGSGSLTPGTVASQTCSGFNVTVTGAVAGSECVVGAPAAGWGILAIGCYVSASNTCVIQFCNPGAVGNTGTTGTYRCRTFSN